MRFREGLVENGVDVWIDQLSVLPGERWQQTIEAAIHRCSHIVVLLSENSIDSPEVEAEWGLALSAGKTVVPILLDQVSIPYRLRSIQSLNLRALGFEQVLSRLLRVLPKREVPKHLLAPTNRSEIPDGYALFRLDLGAGGCKVILMRPSAYSCIGELLDDLFIHYLANFVSPYSYGSEWILAGKPFTKLLVTPWEWVRSPGQSVTQLAPSWPNTTTVEKLAILPKTSWEIVTKEGCTTYVFQDMVNSTYAVASNNERVARWLLADAKAISAVCGEGLLVQKPFAEIDPDGYVYRYVFQDWLNIGLSGSVITDSGKEMSSKLETMFAWWLA